MNYTQMQYHLISNNVYHGLSRVHLKFMKKWECKIHPQLLECETRHKMYTRSNYTFYQIL